MLAASAEAEHLKITTTDSDADTAGAELERGWANHPTTDCRWCSK